MTTSHESRSIPFRILIVTPFYKPAYVYGGPARSIPLLSESLASIGCDVTVYTTDANGKTSLPVATVHSYNVDGVRVHYFQRSRGGNYFYAPDLARACDRNVKDFDLLYIVSTWAYPLIPSSYAAQKSKVPYIISPRTAFMRKPWTGKYLKKMVYHRLIERSLINSASALHYTTNFERSESEWLRLRPPTFVVPNPFDASEFSRLPERGGFRRRRAIPDDVLLVLYLGRLEPLKRLDLTLSSFAEVVSRNPKVRLILAGPDENGYSRSLKRLSAAYGMDDRVTLTGFLDASERLEALVDADVFIQCSSSENFGVAILEAMASGLPVIVSDQVGLAEEIRAAEAGLVVSPEVSKIAASLENLFSSPDERRRLGQRGMKMAQEKFSPANVAEAILHEFAKLTRGRRYSPSSNSSGVPFH